MKVMIISDTHFGARNDNANLLDYMIKCHEEFIIPLMLKHNISHIINLGDLFDRRKYINFLTLNKVNDLIYKNFVCRGMAFDYDILMGNHDQFYKNISSVNSLKEIFAHKFDSVRVYWEPKIVKLWTTNVLYLPWVPSEDIDKAKELLQKTDAKILMTHLDINGFSVNTGAVCSSGFDRELFKKFDLVLSGHYHVKQSMDNIHYVGCPYELYWSDYNQDRGVHILDLEDNSLQFIKNPNRIYHKIVYDNNMVQNKNYAYVKNAFIKVIVRTKDDPVKFDNFIDYLYQQQPASLNIIEDYYELHNTNNNDSDITVSDTQGIIKKSIDDMTIETDKSLVYDFMQNLYTEAVNMEI